MSNEEKFIQEIEETLKTCPDFFTDAAYEGFKRIRDMIKDKKISPEISEAGARILTWMQDNVDKYNNIVNAKIISEQLGLPSSRSASGTMRKLVENGFVSKSGTNPVHYSLTEKGRQPINLTN